MSWLLGGLGYFVFWVSMIVAIILFAVYRKFSPVFYLMSVALYVYTAGYLIREWELSKGFILGILVLSAILFMVMGRYISKKSPKKGNKNSATEKKR